MPKKILVADDDKLIVRCVEGILQHKGYQIIPAYDGLDALVKVKKENPELIILDVEMPEMNGYDVCYQLRLNEKFAKIPIVILTSRDQELEDAFGVMQNIEYASKPIVREVLLERIDYLLKNQDAS